MSAEQASGKKKTTTPKPSF